MSTRKGQAKMDELVAKRLLGIFPAKLTIAEKETITMAAKNIGFEFGEWLFETRNEKDIEINHKLIYLKENDKNKQKMIKMSLAMGIDPDALFASTKGKVEIQTARHICIYRMIEQYGTVKMPYKKLGLILGRGRITVAHGFNVAKSLKNVKDPLFMHMYKLSKNVRL